MTFLKTNHRRMTVTAPAKINLCLGISGRRSDGYHTIDTVFQAVNLYDTLRMTVKPSGITLSVTGPFSRGIPAGKANIVYRAAAQVFSSIQDNRGVAVVLTKNIPSGAGLGGGSSDAAAVITYLPGLFKKKLSDKERLRIARSLGADVPFFLTGGCAQGKGIGDLVTRIPSRSRFWAVLVYPGIHASTAGVYGHLGRRNKLTSSKNIHSIKQSLVRGKSLNTWGRYLFNDLEEPAVKAYPGIGNLRRALYGAGAQFVLMSGSGSTVCAFASSYNRACSIKQKIARAVRAGNGDVWIVRPC